MREAVIVSTPRTPIGKAYRGAFNNLKGPSLGAHAVRAAVERAGLAEDEIEEVVFGSALVEVVENRRMHGGEFLQTSHQPKALHCPFSSSEWQMRVLDSVVEPTPTGLEMNATQVA